jgi:hypothetical protein
MGLSPLPMFAKSSLDERMQRVREEYREMPSLRLTSSQAQRLFGLEPLACAAIFGALTRERFLSLTSGGVFVRGELRVPALSGERG